MLRIYLKAENLKFKHSLFQKLIVLVPLALVLASIVLIYAGMGFGVFSSVMVCNWCMPIASLSIVFLCHMVNHKDQKHQYRTLYSLPIDLKKTFISKTILVAVNLLIISLVISLITAAAECILSGSMLTIGQIVYYIFGYCLLWSSLLWQIPFCLFLDQKIGFAGSVILNLFAGALGGLFFYLTPIFWLFPYSWPARFMVTLFGVLTNGLTAGTDSRLFLSLGEGVLLIILSLLTAVLLTKLFSRWYVKQVYRK